MSFPVRKNDIGEVLTYSLEIPMYEGDNSELGRQAVVGVSSCLRHFAIVDAIIEEGLEDPNEGEPNDILNTHYSQGTEQLISAITALVSIADNLDIDIMQEIYDVPWIV